MLRVADIRAALEGLPDDANVALGLESEDASAEDLAEMVALELVDVGHGLGGLLLQVRVHLGVEDGGATFDDPPEPASFIRPALEEIRRSATPALDAQRAIAGRSVTVEVIRPEPEG